MSSYLIERAECPSSHRIPRVFESSPLEETVPRDRALFQKGEHLAAMEKLVAEITDLPRKFIQTQAKDIEAFLSKGNKLPGLTRVDSSREYHSPLYDERNSRLQHWEVCWKPEDPRLKQAYTWRWRYMVDNEGEVTLKEFAIEARDNDEKGALGRQWMSLEWIMQSPWAKDREEVRLRGSIDLLETVFKKEKLLPTLIADAASPPYEHPEVKVILAERPIIVIESFLGSPSFRISYTLDAQGKPEFERSFDTFFPKPDEDWLRQTELLSQDSWGDGDFELILSSMLSIIPTER